MSHIQNIMLSKSALSILFTCPVLFRAKRDAASYHSVHWLKAEDKQTPMIM